MSNKYPGGLVTSGANAGYSAYFGGTSGFLTTASNAAFTFGTGDFTVEFWCYPISSTGAGGYAYLYAQGPNTTAAFGIYFEGGVFKVWNGSAVITGTTSRTTSNWYHVAVSRSGTSMRLFVNGVQDGSTATNSSNITTGSTYGANIGRWAEISDVNYLVGYVSNVRVLKGTALYTAAFTPPTQLLNITNTQLLACNSPAIVDQSSNNFTITTNGNAAVSTFTPFVGTQLVPNPNTLANTQGVWSISDAAYWMSQNKWPMPPNYSLQSLRFNSADSAKLTRTPASAGNRRTWTWSGWVKRSRLGATNEGIFEAYSATPAVTTFSFSSDALRLQLYTDPTTNLFFTTAAVFRDVSAWYHIVLAFDTTQASTANVAKIYVNGVQQTVNFTAITGSYVQNTQWLVNSSGVLHNIGVYNNADLLNGYMADVNFVDGQALTPSSFGANDPNTGVWSPVPYSGTYGTNGFRLSFQDNTGTTATTLGKDYSGNGNNWTPNNFSVAAGSGNDSLTDGPTNWGIDYGNGGEVRGNYATINPLMTPQFSQTYSNGNLECTGNYAYTNAQSTICVSSGKWYAEMVVNVKNSALCSVGVFNKSLTNFISNASGNPGSVGYWSDAQKSVDGTTSAYGATYGVNDVIGVAMDITGNSITFYKNGVSQGAISYTFDTSGAWGFLTGGGGTFSAGDKVTWNFGQRPFAYPAPPGFKCLCTTNLPIPTVGATSTTQANKYFDATTYTGNGSTNIITNAGSFQPDIVWAKNRANAYFHGLYDVIRGTGTTKSLYSNSTDPEGTYSANQNLVSFNSNGFTLGATSSTNAINDNGTAHVAWQWKAGGTGVSNTAGSISSTVSANTTAGISIVTYSGVNTSPNTVGHGLGAVPKFWLIKNRSSSSGNWVFNYVLNGVVYYMFLNSTAAANAQGSPWSTLPSSSVVTLGGNDANTCQSGSNYVMYAFAEIVGFSRLGSYTGNSSTDGPFVYCGFRPRFIMIKRSDSATFNWWMEDSARDTYNVAGLDLAANLAAAEQNDTPVLDMLSNGFKLRTSSYTGFNQSGGTYIFMAFAEAPFNYSRAR